MVQSKGFGVVALGLMLVLAGCGGENDKMFTDSRDNQNYRTVTIGNTTWMAQNLNFKMDDSWCYDEDEANCAQYGRLYIWDAAMNACPSGWRLPARSDWDNMLQVIGGVRDSDGDYDEIGKKLKSKTGWDICFDKDLNHFKCDNNGTDSFGFSALSGGGRVANGVFKDVGTLSYWWSATEFEAGGVWSRYMFSGFDYVYEGGANKGLGHSVRCVKNVRP